MAGCLVKGRKATKMWLNVCVSLGTVHNVLDKFVATGDVSANKQPARESLRRLDHYHDLLVIGLVLDQPDIYFREICQYLHSV